MAAAPGPHLGASSLMSGTLMVCRAMAASGADTRLTLWEMTCAGALRSAGGGPRCTATTPRAEWNATDSMMGDSSLPAGETVRDMVSDNDSARHAVRRDTAMKVVSYTTDDNDNS